jgi:Ca2+-binding EF-hand superfamily protein
LVAEVTVVEKEGVKRIFSALDCDGDGVVSAGDVLVCLEREKSTLSEDQIAKIIRSVSLIIPVRPL